MIKWMLLIGALLAPHSGYADSSDIPLLPPRSQAVATAKSKSRSSQRNYRRYSRYATQQKYRTKKVVVIQSQERTPTYATVSASSPKSRGKTLIGGFELGVVGSPNNASADALGQRFLYGGRVFAVLPVFGNRWFLKPSLGFFTRSEGTGKPQVSQYQGEVGLGLQYLLGKTKAITWIVGLASRLELQFSRTSVGVVSGSASTSSVSSTSPIGFGGRVGPAAGMTIRASESLGIVVDLETGFTLTRPVQLKTGLAAGLLFKL